MMMFIEINGIYRNLWHTFCIHVTVSKLVASCYKYWYQRAIVKGSDVPSLRSLLEDEEWMTLKPGFHYPSWRPELMARVDGWPVSITNTARQLG